MATLSTQLGLGAADADRLKWCVARAPTQGRAYPRHRYQEAEKTNGRWAMAAVVGILVTELLGKPKWFEAGAEEYWMPSGPLLAVEFLIMGFFELKRYNGWVETKTVRVWWQRSMLSLHHQPSFSRALSTPSLLTPSTKTPRTTLSRR